MRLLWRAAGLIRLNVCKLIGISFEVVLEAFDKLVTTDVNTSLHRKSHRHLLLVVKDVDLLLSIFISSE